MSELVCHDCGKRIPEGKTMWRAENGTLVPVHRDCVQGFTYDPHKKKRTADVGASTVQG